MNAERYQRVVSIFQGALDLADGERTRFVHEQCGDDSALRDEIMTMLGADEASDEFADAQVDARRALPPLEMPTLDGYRLARCLGEGGMGVVYEAEQAYPERSVALKMLRGGFASTSLRQRFEREIKLLAKLRHPGIAQIYDANVGESGASPFFTMELVDGVDLVTYCRERDLDERARLELVVRVCDAIQYAHQRGVIHRDIKPANILVEVEDGVAQPKVLDFGVGRAAETDHAGSIATNAGQIVGTVPYMSPEQVGGRSEDVGTLSDVYALGVMLYEVLVGGLPYDVRDCPLTEAARIIREVDPKKPSSSIPTYRGDVDTIILKCLEKEPARRYQSAGDLGDDIRRFLRHEPIVGRPATAMYQLRKFARRHRALVVGATATLLAIVGGAVAAGVFARSAHMQSQQSQRTAYRAAIEAAAYAIALDDPGAARRHLDGTPEHLRGWEWRYLDASLVPDVVAIDLGQEMERLGGMDVANRAIPVIGVATSDDGVRIIDVEHAVELDRIRTGAATTRVAVSADGAHVAAADADHVVQVRDRSSGERVGTPIDTGGTARIDIDESGTTLVAVTSDPVAVRVFDVKSGGERWHHVCRSLEAGRVVIDQDRGRVVVIDGTNAHIFDAASGDELAYRRRNSTFWARSCAFDASGEELAVTDQQGRVWLHEAETLEQIGGILTRAPKINDATALGDGDVLTVSADGRARWQRMSDGETRRSRQFVGPVQYVGATPDRRGVWMVTKSGMAWHGLDTAPSRALEGHASYVYSVAFSRDGGMIASGGGTRVVNLWDADTGALIRSVRLTAEGGAVAALAFGDEDRVVRVIRKTGVLTEWSLEDDAVTSVKRGWAKLRHLELDAFDWRTVAGGSYTSHAIGGIRLITVSHDGSRAASRVEGIARIIDLARGSVVTELDVTGDVQALALSPTGDELAVGGRHGDLRVLSVSSGREVARHTPHTDRVMALEYSPDGTRLATGADDGAVLLWDTTTYERVGALPGHTDYIHCLRFSPDGTQLVSAGGDGIIRIWDTIPARERRAAR